MTMQRLLEIVRTLRSENGCPWDREQTLESIRQYLVEECHEVLDAIDSGEPGRHREELGDLLLQVVLQAQIQNEQGSFSFGDVVEGLCEKLVRRHPHVFGDTRVSGSAEVLRNWEEIKASEKRAGNMAQAGAGPRSSVADFPKSLPALRKAHQVQSRAARAGFDPVGSREPLAALEEKFERLKNGQADEELFGDLLFAVVRLCRERSVNAEDALNGAVERFVQCDGEDGRQKSEVRGRFRNI